MKVIFLSAALFVSYMNLVSASLLIDRIYESDTFAEGIPMKVVYNIYNNYPL